MSPFATKIGVKLQCSISENIIKEVKSIIPLILKTFPSYNQHNEITRTGFLTDIITKKWLNLQAILFQAKTKRESLQIYILEGKTLIIFLFSKCT